MAGSVPAPTSPLTLVSLCLVVLVAFVVESAAGFGGTVVSVSLGSQLMAVDDVLLRFLPANLLLSLVMVIRTWRHVDGRTLFVKIAPFMGIGMIVGTMVAKVASPEIVKVLFAAFVLALAGLELRKVPPREVENEGVLANEPSKGTPEADTKALPLAVSAGALVAAGVLHGMFACGGPLAVWVAGRDLPDKSRFRATLSALWLVLNGVLVVGYLVERKLTVASFQDSGMLVVPLVVGMIVGERVHRSLSPARFRRAVFMLLGVAALVLLARSIVTMTHHPA